MNALRAILASLLLITPALQAAEMPAVVLPVVQPQPTFAQKASNRIKSLWASIQGTKRRSRTSNGFSFIKRHKIKFTVGLGLTALGLYTYYKYKQTGVNPIRRAKANLNRYSSSIAGHWDTAQTYFNENIAPHFASEPVLQTRECGICMSDIDSNQFKTLGCGHNSYCNACLLRSLDIALKNKNTGSLNCPEPACKTKLAEADIRKLTRQNRNKYNQFLNILRDERIILSGGMQHCPTPDCQYYFINDEPLNFWANYECPSCHQNYCANCLKNHDQGLSCTGAAEVERLDPQGDQAFNEWRQKNTRPCPGCHKAIQKNGGCIHMTCSNNAGGCGYQFCWHCGAEWKNRLHQQGNVVNEGDFYDCTNPREWWLAQNN